MTKTDRCEQEFMSVCFCYNGELLAVKRMAGLILLPSFLHVRWRWLPMLRPVLPVTPTMIPGNTLSPLRTMIEDK